MVRTALPADLPRLRQIFRTSVENLGPTQYDLSQTAVWASFAEHPDFGDYIYNGTTFVYCDHTGTVQGFAGIDLKGHITLVYVAPDFARRGIGSQLVEKLLALARAKGFAPISVEASRLSVGLFQKFGFKELEWEIVDRNGVEIDRVRMIHPFE